MDRADKLILGIGHVLQRDDGVGVRAAEILAKLPLPDDVEVYDAGLTGWELGSVIEHRKLVVVLDAIDAGAEPGAVFRVTPEHLRPALRGGMSVHEFHLLDALEETRLLGTAPEKVVIFAVQPRDLSTGIGLSDEVEAGLQRALPLALRELGVPEDLLDTTDADADGGWPVRMTREGGLAWTPN